MSQGRSEWRQGMSAKTVAAFLCGVIAAGTGTAAALEARQVFRLQMGDEAQYSKVKCQAENVGLTAASTVGAYTATGSSTGRPISACSTYAA
jgi:hypothetical protein